MINRLKVKQLIYIKFTKQELTSKNGRGNGEREY
jgi:hypothetical protein